MRFLIQLDCAGTPLRGYVFDDAKLVRRVFVDDGQRAFAV
jgi:hypothetical protein